MTKPAMKGMLAAGGAAACFFDASFGAVAQTHEHAPLGPHVHGAAELSLAVEDDVLYAELNTPLVNIAGFEHAPRSPAENTAYRAAIDVLQAGDFLSFDGARCRLDDVALTEPAWGADARAPQARHGFEARHEHRNGQRHDQPHERDQHRRGEEGGGGGGGEESSNRGAVGHAEIIASYTYSCDGLDRLRGLETRLFDLFDRIEAITVVYLGETAITGALTPQRPKLELE